MMKDKLGTGLKLSGCSVAVAAALAASAPAHAVQFDLGNWEGSWDNTITYGISWRAEDQDPKLLGPSGIRRRERRTGLRQRARP